jgi:hypothetical protein
MTTNKSTKSMSSIELFETSEWERLEAYELKIESNITELPLQDYLYQKALIKQFARNISEGKPLVPTEMLSDAPCSNLRANEHWEYLQRHRSAIFTAFEKGELIQGWILHDDYPEFLAAIGKKRKIRTALSKNGQNGYYQAIMTEP